MAWPFLGLAILFEIVGTISLKLSHGFAHLVPSLVIFPAYAASFVFLALAVKAIPISIAYAVWSAVGIAVISVVGMVWLDEPMTAAKVLFIAITIVGIVGLCLCGSHETST